MTVPLRALAELLCLEIKNIARRCGRRSFVRPCSPWEGITNWSFVAEHHHHRQVCLISVKFGSQWADRSLAAPVPQPKAGGPVAPATPFVRKPVFKNAQSSPLHSVVESLAADGAVTQALTHSLDSTVAHLPDLFKSTGPPAPVEAVQNTVATVKEAKPRLLETIQISSGLIPQMMQPATREIGQWWSRPRASRHADGVVPNRETDILIAEGWRIYP